MTERRRTTASHGTQALYTHQGRHHRLDRADNKDPEAFWLLKVNSVVLTGYFIHSTASKLVSASQGNRANKATGEPY
jgi:hypothetical protein